MEQSAEMGQEGFGAGGFWGVEAAPPLVNPLCGNTSLLRDFLFFLLKVCQGWEEPCASTPPKAGQN
jgi:hypothetical protein